MTAIMAATPRESRGVAMARRRLKKRAEAGGRKSRLPRTNISQAMRKTAAGDGHHGIPDEADGGKGKIELGEALPAAEPVDDGDFLSSRGWSSTKSRN